MKTYSIRAIEVTSEIVKDEVSSDSRLPENQRRSIHIRSTCQSPRWGTRTQGQSLSCPDDYKDAVAFEDIRFRAAETLVKTEPGGGVFGLGAEVVGPTGKRMMSFCAVDLSFSPCLLQPELIKFMEMPVTGEFYCQVVNGQLHHIPLHRGAIKFGDIEIWTKFLPLTYSGPVVLGGDFFQQYLRGKERLIHELVMPDHMRTLLNAARCKKNYVLILGKYGKEREHLLIIKRALAERGLTGLILDEYPDIEEQSLPEKTVAYASMCRFVLVDDFAPSGHIDELRVCQNLKFVTALLRLKGRASTAMQADIADEVSYIHEFSYEEEAELESVVAQAAKWANEAVTTRAHALNRMYEWRSPEKIMA